MGWDAHSSAPMAKSKGQLKYKRHREAFSQAAENVREKTKGVDGFLRLGSLDCSLCLKMLENAQMSSLYPCSWYQAWGDEGMGPENVKHIYRLLNWNFTYRPEAAWAYWSAKEFVRVCAEQGLGIRFTY